MSVPWLLLEADQMAPDAWLRWKYVGEDLGSRHVWMLSDILNQDHPRFRKTRLFVEDLPLRYFEDELEKTYLQSIPTKLLVSIKMAHPTQPLSTRLDSLKALLLQAPQLETFHYEDRGQGIQFVFAQNERLPALRDLLLKHYDWHHPSEDVTAHWDFSQMRSLQLISVPVYNFLASVDFSNFAHLHTLHVEDFSAHLPDRRRDATLSLHDLIKDHILALRTLEMTCHTTIFRVDAVLAHASTLQVLSLRDHVGFSDEDRRCPSLRVNDLVLLAQRLRQLHTLELDMDVASTEAFGFLAGLCEFRKLHTLVLHVQTNLRPNDRVPPGRDLDREAAMRTFALLLREKVSHGSDTSWQRITINVGGWRKVMLRRLSEAWRRQNERGVFAERCFVLKHNEMGIREVREETCIERSRAESPAETDYPHHDDDEMDED
jgi:hypothetical protein